MVHPNADLAEVQNNTVDQDIADLEILKQRLPPRLREKFDTIALKQKAEKQRHAQHQQPKK
jgi:hypothetical protein